MSDNFFDLVYRVVLQVPKGGVTTYSAVARFLNNPRGSRSVGWAMRQCNLPEVPCHRVIKSDGSIGGYGDEGVAKKAKLLRKEGVMITQGKVDLSKYEFRAFTLANFG